MQESDILLTIRELQIIELNPSDVIVVQVHEGITLQAKDVALISAQIGEKFPHNEVIILCGADMGVIRKGND